MEKVENLKGGSLDFDNKVDVEIQDFEETICRKYYQVNCFVSNQSMKILSSNIIIIFIYFIILSILFFYLILKLFVAFVANTGMISVGVGVGLSGLVIAQLKDSRKDIKLTLDEESWFGNKQ